MYTSADEFSHRTMCWTDHWRVPHCCKRLEVELLVRRYCGRVALS